MPESQCTGQGIGGIRIGRLWKFEQMTDHVLHLFFAGASGAHDRLLHLQGRDLMHQYLAGGQGGNGNPAGLAE